MPYVEVEKGVQYYYEEVGQGKPIVLIHGWGANRKVWERQIVDFSDKYRVITIDCRGCGNSDRPAHGYEISQLADDIHQVIQHLNLKDATLVGWSAGGTVVVDYVSRYHGDAVTKAVSVGGAVPRYTSTDDFPLGGPLEAVQGTLAAMKANRPAIVRGIADGCFHADVGQATKDWFFNVFLEQSFFTEKTMEDLAVVDLRAQLKDIRVPVAFFHGTHDGVVPYELSDYAAKEVPNATLVSFENSSHAPFVEEIEKFNNELLSFIES